MLPSQRVVMCGEGWEQPVLAVCMPQGPRVGIGLMVRLCQGNTICFNTPRAWESGSQKSGSQDLVHSGALHRSDPCKPTPVPWSGHCVSPKPSSCMAHPTLILLLAPSWGFRCCSHQVCLSWSRIRARDGLRAPGLAAWRMLHCQQLVSFKRETLEASERPPPDISSEPYY